MTGLPLVECPACHVEGGLEMFLGTDDARGVVAQMARCPGPPALRKALLRYVGLHAPAQRRITWDRAEKLLGEMTDLIESGRVERNGRNLPAPLDYWQQALDTLFAKPDLRRPLKGHGLILEIIAGLADKDQAREEQRRLVQGRGETPRGTPPPIPSPRADEQKKPHNRAAAAAALATMKSTIEKGS